MTTKLHEALTAHVHENKGEEVADKIASFVGSWYFIIGQSILVILWIIVNVTAYALSWDPYPFILLNLLFSTQAAYTAPIILQSQNRSATRDRRQALLDYHTNKTAKDEIEELQRRFDIIERDYLQVILAKVNEKK